MRRHLRPTLEGMEPRKLLSITAPPAPTPPVIFHPVHVPIGPMPSSETGTTTSHVAVSPITPIIPIVPPSGPEPGRTNGPISFSPITPIVPPSGPKPGETTAPMAVSLTTNQTNYMPGQVVHMTLTETNNTGKPVFVNYGPSIGGFYITAGSRTIWRSNSGVNPLFIVHRMLLPGQSITLTANWTATAAVGTYQVHNQMAPEATATFHILAQA
jgi:hypothetical protein